MKVTVDWQRRWPIYRFLAPIREIRELLEALPRKTLRKVVLPQALVHPFLTSTKMVFTIRTDLLHPRICRAPQIIVVDGHLRVRILRIQTELDQTLVSEEALPFAIFGVAETKFLLVLRIRAAQKAVRLLFNSSNVLRKRAPKKRKKMSN